MVPWWLVAEVSFPGALTRLTSHTYPKPLRF